MPEKLSDELEKILIMNDDHYAKRSKIIMFVGTKCDEEANTIFGNALPPDSDELSVGKNLPQDADIFTDEEVNNAAKKVYANLISRGL